MWPRSEAGWCEGNCTLIGMEFSVCGWGARRGGVRESALLL